MVFEKNLITMVKGLRAARGEEEHYISGQLREIREELRSTVMKTKTTAILKLAYLNMLGYDISWASFPHAASSIFMCLAFIMTLTTSLCVLSRFINTDLFSAGVATAMLSETTQAALMLINYQGLQWGVPMGCLGARPERSRLRLWDSL